MRLTSSRCEISGDLPVQITGQGRTAGRFPLLIRAFFPNGKTAIFDYLVAIDQNLNICSLNEAKFDSSAHMIDAWSHLMCPPGNITFVGFERHAQGVRVLRHRLLYSPNISSHPKPQPSF